MDRVRAVTLNLWGEQPPLERRLAIIIEGMRALAPDAIALQEVRAVPGQVPNTAETIARALGYEIAYAVATPWGGGEEGLAILSRHPITHSDHLELPHATTSERRIVLGAAIATPIGELGVFTTHLTYRLADGARRADQAEAVDRFVAGWGALRPSLLPRLVLGDFNAIAEADEIRFMRGLHSLAGRRTYYQDAWAKVHGTAPGYTWARANPYTDKLHWLDRDRRIDYAFVSPIARDGRGEILDCSLLFDRATDDGAFASDHFGLLVDVRVSATR